MKTLNVGCGLDKWGDIRLDLNLTFPYAQGPRKSSLNVRASVTHLPFREARFERVRAWHVLEHTSEPWTVTRELLRVSAGTVDIRVPTGNFWQMVTELAHLFMVVVAVARGRSSPVEFLDCLKQIHAWPNRWRDHRWLIRPPSAEAHHYLGFLPYELEIQVSKANWAPRP